jgi:protein phosphatase 2C family protein 2/3
MSIDHGRKVLALSNDHKPNYPTEKNRIIMNGGNIYQSLITTKSGAVVPGPWRINPGRLSVSRALGDIQAKDEKY